MEVCAGPFLEDLEEVDLLRPLLGDVVYRSERVSADVYTVYGVDRHACMALLASPAGYIPARGRERPQTSEPEQVDRDRDLCAPCAC